MDLAQPPKVKLIEFEIRMKSNRDEEFKKTPFKNIVRLHNWIEYFRFYSVLEKNSLKVSFPY